MNKSGWTGLGLTYVGTVIGAGYASGQEIWQFFSRHGEAGAFGLLLAGTLFGLVGYFALEAGRTRFAGFQPFLGAAYGGGARWLDMAVGLFLAAGVGVVTAGGGAAIHQLVGVPVAVGGVLILGLVLATARGGASAVIRANSILVPVLMALIAATAVFSPPAARTTAVADAAGWWLSAFLYASYNLFTAATVLIGLGRRLPDRRSSAMGAGLGAVVLTATALLEHRALVGMGSVGALPMLDAAQALHPGLGLAYTVCLLLALYTTGIGEAWALLERYGPRVLAGLWGCALFLLWPFAALVGTVYPFLGVMSVVFWLPLLPPFRPGPGR